MFKHLTTLMAVLFLLKFHPSVVYMRNMQEIVTVVVRPSFFTFIRPHKVAPYCFKFQLYDVLHFCFVTQYANSLTTVKAMLFLLKFHPSVVYMRSMQEIVTLVVGPSFFRFIRPTKLHHILS